LLLDPPGVDALRTLLLPRATLVTPNLREAELLTGRPVRGPADMRDAARALLDLGARAVLVKGGHLAGDAIDVFDDARESPGLRPPVVESCRAPHPAPALRPAPPAGLAAGRALADAASGGKRFAPRAIAGAAALGHGARLLDLRVRLDDV